MTLWRKKDKVKFAPATLAESSEPDTNPGRGWYQLFSFDIGKPMEMGLLKGSVNEKDRLVLLLMNIGSCRTYDLTESMLEYLQQIFVFFSERKQEMIVRIVYDTEGKGLEREPASLEQVQRHMRQIGPVLRRFSGHIYTLQGLFVGNWGEMHGSRYLSDEKLRSLAETLWDAIGGSCYLAVRTPRQRRLLEQSRIDMQKVGLFDDGLFGSETHLGTFGVEADTSKRESAWLPEKELEYLNASCGRVPNGGEAVLGEGIGAERIIGTLESMHLTYLNRVYDARILELWRREIFRDGRSLYDYIGNRLGYRFVLKKVWMEKKRREVMLFFSGENQGFGNLLRESELRLHVQRNRNDCFCSRLDVDPRQWDSKKEFTCSCLLPGHAAPSEGSQPYELFLEMKKRDGEVIRFANAPTGDTVFLGSLLGWEMD